MSYKNVYSPYQCYENRYGKDSPGAQASGEILVLDRAEILNGNTITVPGPGGPVVYELLDGGFPTPGMQPVDISGAVTSADVADLIYAAVLLAQPELTPVQPDATTVSMTYPVPLSGLAPITTTGPAQAIQVAGWSGGSAPTYDEILPLRWGLSRGVAPLGGGRGPRGPIVG